MQNKWTLVLAAFMFVLFSSFFSWFFSDTGSPGTKIAHQITGEVRKKLKANYGLNLMGISEEGPDGKYITIGLEISSNKVLTKEEGRVLLLCCLREGLESFNSHPEFRPYMANVPFTLRNLTITIYIQPINEIEVYYPDIGVFALYKNALRYKCDSPESPLSEYFAEEIEPYEEALKIVQGRQKRAETTKEQM